MTVGRSAGINRALAVLCIVAQLFCGLSRVEARHHRSRSHKERAARPDKRRHASVTLDSKPASADLPDPLRLEPPPTGEPGAINYEAMAQELEAAYRRTPSLDLLFRLGVVAKLRGRTVEAQDRMRRYLADPLTVSGGVEQQEAERVLALPREPSGEVSIVADAEGLILVDGRALGALPLSLPLLVPTGKHAVALEMSDKTMKGTVEVLDGRGAEVRFSRESGAVVVTLPPAVIVVTELADTMATTEHVRRIQQMTEKLIQKAHLAIYSKEAALARTPKLADCLRTVACQAQLAVKTDADYVLSLQVERKTNGTDLGLSIRFVDGEVEDVAAESREDCRNCTQEQLLTKLAVALPKVLKEGASRSRGTVLITSEPKGAEVLRGSRVLGNTPFQHAAFVGRQSLIIKLSDHEQATIELVVEEGKKASSSVVLVSKEPPPAPLRREPTTPPVHSPSRPLWRLVTGSVAIGLGLALAGFGASGIAIDNQCVTDPEPPILHCRDRFDTLGTGAGLLGAGAGLSLAGAILIAIPPPKAEPMRRVSLPSVFPSAETVPALAISF